MPRGHRPSGLPIATVSQASVRVSPYLEVYRQSRKRCHHRSSSGTIRRERSPNFLMTTTNKLNKFVTPAVIVRQASPIATVSRPQSGSPPYLEAFGTINEINLSALGHRPSGSPIATVSSASVGYPPVLW